MPRSTPRNNDEHVTYDPSPLDPWGLLTPKEKASAAITHAKLVRIPPKPRPAHPVRETPSVPEDAQCVFRHSLREPRPVTHRLTRSGRPTLYPVGSFVCESCAAVINEPEYGTHDVERI